jgi:Flp pilus assembly pilin Flp
MSSAITALLELRTRVLGALEGRSKEEGASATEYAVIVAIVVAALVLIGTVFTDVLSDLWTGMVAQIRDNFIDN